MCQPYIESAPTVSDCIIRLIEVTMLLHSMNDCVHKMDSISLVSCQYG